MRYERGELSTARADLLRSLSILETSGSGQTLDAARVRAHLARIAYEQHQPAAAYREIDAVIAIVRDRAGVETAEYAQMLRWKALLLIRDERWSDAAPLLAQAHSTAEREEAANEPRLLVSREEAALAYCLAHQRSDAGRELATARAMRHDQVAPWAAWMEDAISAACGSGTPETQRVALATARSRVEAELGPSAPMLRLIDKLPAPKSDP